MKSPGQISDEAAAGLAAVEALRLAVDELAAMLPAPRRPLELHLPWGPDAATDDVAYRKRIRARERSTAPSTVTTGPTISVVVPVYRPELWYFRSCVESVRGQAYAPWELCLCDDASGDGELSAYLAGLARDDDRVRVTSLESNGGISEATNAALALASGEFVALLDHDDLLAPGALGEVAAAALEHPDVDVLYSDEDKISEDGTRYQPHFKPNWAPDLLLAYPYLGHLLVVRRTLLERIGGFRSAFDGSQDFDVMLRATEQARRVVHVPKVLYHWRAIAGSAAGDTAAKPWAHVASRKAVEDAVKRRSIAATVEDGPFPGAYHVRRRVSGSRRIAAIVPFRDQAALTAQCLESLQEEVGPHELDVILVDNGSVEPETLALRRRLSQDVLVIDYPEMFNWSTINNLAAAESDADLLLFLNNDVEGRRPGWLSAMVELAERPDVGAVGARLLFPNGVVQHAGVVVGQHGIAGHLFMGLPAGATGYFGWDRVVRPYSAVTGACLMTRRSVFEDSGGFDEQLEVAFNDIDYCLRLVDSGLQVLYTPHAELVHHESVSRGMSGFVHDYRYFLRKWPRARLHDDPFYNPNLGLFAQWCPVREEDEDQNWEKVIDQLEGRPLRPCRD